MMQNYVWAILKAHKFIVNRPKSKPNYSILYKTTMDNVWSIWRTLEIRLDGL